MRNIALFDLDGTITHRDTMIAFLIHHMGWARTMGLLGIVMPLLVLGRTGLIDKDAAKRTLIRIALKGKRIEALAGEASVFAKHVMPGLLRPSAMVRIREHVKAGDRVIVVTASCRLWLEAWCRTQDLELIATELQVKDGFFTGALATPNCKGKEKVERIAAEVDMSSTEVLHAYGDSKADEPMLALATYRYYKPFR